MSLRKSFESHRGRSIAKIDHFFDIYEPHLARFRRDAVKVLEIGVDKGGSLELWQHYFGEQAEVHGIDLNPETLSCAPPGCHVHIGRQDDPTFIDGILANHGPFDIVIDDGSHLPRDQVASFELIYPRLSEHGIYICEDTFTGYWADYRDHDPTAVPFVDYARQLVDDLHGFWRGDGGPQPSAFTRITRGIYFYSGATVLERQPVTEPVYVTRNGDDLVVTNVEELKAAAKKHFNPS